jgi:hypothetical protein
VEGVGVEWRGEGAGAGRVGRFQWSGAMGSASPVVFLFCHVFCVVQAIANYRIFAYPSKVEVILKT